MVEICPASDLRACHSLLGGTETTKGKSFRCWLLLASDILQPGLNLHTSVLLWGLLRLWLLGSFNLSSWGGGGGRHDWNRWPYHYHGSHVGENLQWGQGPGLFCSLLTEVHRELQGGEETSPWCDCCRHLIVRQVCSFFTHICCDAEPQIFHKRELRE